MPANDTQIADNLWAAGLVVADYYTPGLLAHVLTDVCLDCDWEADSEDWSVVFCDEHDRRKVLAKWQ